MKESSQVTILGGGITGLATGYYARKHSLPYAIYEAQSRFGGNAVTFEENGFLFDSGAHRFHDKSPEITTEIKNLLGQDLKKINRLSQIYYRGRFLNFPLSPLNLVTGLHVSDLFSAAWDLLQRPKNPPEGEDDFKSRSLRHYGKKLSELFLLNYSEKLWGRPAEMLAPDIAAKRMEKLSVKTMLRELVSGEKAKSEHLDGSYYYPTHGIGMIPERLIAGCGKENLHLQSRISRIDHDGRRITAIEVNGSKTIKTPGWIVNTLPLSLLVRLLSPAPSLKLTELASQLQFRHLSLVVLFLNRPSITRSSSVYFPDKRLPFTRIHEPRNRSLAMSPKGKTSLVVEYPCDPNSSDWEEVNPQLVEKTTASLIALGWIKPGDVLGSKVVRIPYAYPVLTKSFTSTLSEIASAMRQWENLMTIGRNGQFVYGFIHDMMGFGKSAVDHILKTPAFSPEGSHAR